MSRTIHLDATYSVSERPTGVANYSREILFGLGREYASDAFCFCYRPHRFLGSYHDELAANCYRSLLVEGLLPHSPRLFHGLNQRLPSQRLRRAVVTFHDLFVLTSEYSTTDFRERFSKQARDAAARADVAICVSAFTASQVEQLLRVPASRIRVVHHGVEIPPLELVRPVEEREPIVLFVGAIQKRKNVAALVRAFAALPAPWRLELIGDRGYGWEEVEIAIAESPARDRIALTGYCDDATLRARYARASIFAFPSMDEGFGMPILEAMAWGIPVLTANRSAMPEVAGDAAVLVDPGNEPDLAGALVTLSEDAAARIRLAGLGRQRAQEFSWKRAVHQTMAVYRELSAA